VVQRKLNNYIRELQDGNHEGSVISIATVESLPPDDKLMWREIRKELENIGISVAAFDANKAFILEWFQRASEENAFEELGPDDDSNSGSTEDDSRPSSLYSKELLIYVEDVAQEEETPGSNTALESLSRVSPEAKNKVKESVVFNFANAVTPSPEVNDNPGLLSGTITTTPVTSGYTPFLDTEKAISEEQKAFEHLPSGIRASHVSCYLSSSEIQFLRKQAIWQASRFEVLSQKDVKTLSHELRLLDKRCEYLRKTHRSLRSARRNLQNRIASYLRPPSSASTASTARFSPESVPKQEEALSELDSIIDDWISKLEAAENRRTRVRQKLLEHLSAALIMPPLPTLSA
jgi:hypothetical protein